MTLQPSAVNHHFVTYRFGHHEALMPPLSVLIWSAMLEHVVAAKGEIPTLLSHCGGGQENAVQHHALASWSFIVLTASMLRVQ